MDRKIYLGYVQSLENGAKMSKSGRIAKGVRRDFSRRDGTGRARGSEARGSVRVARRQWKGKQADWQARVQGAHLC